ncbi:MAG: TetR/AcrR family transcriptional regulator [Actinomycetota bacterium]
MSTTATATTSPRQTIATDRIDPRVRRTRKDVRRAAGELLLGEGWDAVTHAKVAGAAGYSRATIYAHWPRPVDLLIEAFNHIGAIPHHEPTGDLRQDLIDELTVFRTVLVDHGLARVLTTLADRATTSPELAEFRDSIVAEGNRLFETIFRQHQSPEQAELSSALVLGTVYYLATMTDEPITDDTLIGIVDRVIG